jgi:hypothetical protein
MDSAAKLLAIGVVNSDNCPCNVAKEAHVFECLAESGRSPFRRSLTIRRFGAKSSARAPAPLKHSRFTDDEPAKPDYSMEERTTRTLVTFSRPFSLTGIEGSQPAGIYRIEMVDALIDSAPYLSPAYRRISTTIELPAVGASSAQRQLSAIDSRELEAALEQDAALPR